MIINMDSSVILFRINNLCKKVNEILDRFLNAPKVSVSQPSSHSDGNYVPKTYNPFYRCLPKYAQGVNGEHEVLKGVLRFFEWSDLNRAPVLFYRLEDFIVFIRRSNIPISDTERNLILSTHNPYVTCEEGKAKLIIRGSSADLNTALSISRQFSNDSNNNGSSSNGGYVIPSIRGLGTAPQHDDFNTPTKPYQGEYVGEWFENR